MNYANLKHWVFILLICLIGQMCLIKYVSIRQNV
jgi:hypothetical protein